MDSISYIRSKIENEVFIHADSKEAVDDAGNAMLWLFDFRRVTLESRFLNSFCELFFTYTEKYFPFQVGGVEVASIPLLSAVVLSAESRGTPINGFFIRKSRKKQGLLQTIEGKVTEDPIILVDDLINSGGSLMRQVEILEGLGKKITAIFVILRFREIEYYHYFAEKNIPIISLFSLDDFTATLNVRNLVSKEQKPVPMPFEQAWLFQSEYPNYFYVLPKSAPLLDDLHVYMGADNGYFWAIDRHTGKPAWKYRIPFGAQGKFIFSTPALFKESVFFGAYDGNVYALDRLTGKRKWVFMEADWVGSSPVIATDLGLLFIGLEFGLIGKRGGIVAINANTGEKKWEYRMKGLTHATPAYSKNHSVVACGCNDGTFSLFDAVGGGLRWVKNVGGAIRYAPAFQDKLGIVCFGAEDGKFYALDVSTGESRFEFNIEFGVYSTPLIVHERAYVAGLDKKLYCIDLLSGKILWHFETRGRIFSSPVFAFGSIYVGSNDGRLYELDSETGKNTALFQTTERITNRIAYDEHTGEIFLPTFANELYCLKRKSL